MVDIVTYEKRDVFISGCGSEMVMNKRCKWSSNGRHPKLPSAQLCRRDTWLVLIFQLWLSIGLHVHGDSLSDAWYWCKSYARVRYYNASHVQLNHSNVNAKSTPFIRLSRSDVCII
jgi:hypothetical protein